MSDPKPQNRHMPNPANQLKAKPTQMTLEVIKQFARCNYTRRDFPLPDKTFIIN
ncbi:MAG: hypothetical protein QM237_01730 [Bacteroidota bacterium]|nr:hypothetical protein [Bacteroidota bacterium]HHU97293.1 hypothetical protein [Petrimonas sp.]